MQEQAACDAAGAGDSAGEEAAVQRAVFVNGQGDGIGTDLEPPVFRGQRGQGVSGAFVGIRKLMVSARSTQRGSGKYYISVHR